MSEKGCQPSTTVTENSQEHRNFKDKASFFCTEPSYTRAVESGEDTNDTDMRDLDGGYGWFIVLGSLAIQIVSLAVVDAW